MIIKYEIRSSKNNAVVSIQYSKYRVFATHDNLLDSLSAAKTLLAADPLAKDRIYITRSEYANELNRRRDFCITRSIVWSGPFHGADALNEMIESAGQI